jgi:polar amino acid transport system substrate-binding protein
MEQLTQKLKDGTMEILEVPFPSLSDNKILVRNHYSVISSGTEGKTVTDARKGYIAKAKSRKKELLQIIDSIKTLGFKETYDIVMNKLEVPSPLGYSCSGVVIAVGASIKNIKVGDRLACGGQGAFHADVVSVYENLSVHVPANVSLQEAAFSTIASIAIQGIRQSKLVFGENCLVIGLGLIGQMTMEVLEAAGIKIIGVDIDEVKVEIAKKNGFINSFNRNNNAIKDIISNFSNGVGVDAVIITAGTSSLDPINFAGEVSRKKGRVIIVGAVPTGFDRNNFYKKELEVKMSCSYGPGRYDVNYEEKGKDYPIGYVRFTENRNMQTFMELLSQKKINVSKFITRVFDLEDAEKAYSLILNGKEEFLGLLIKYEQEKQLKQSVKIDVKTIPNKKPDVAFIGAGSFAQNILLPNVKDLVNFDTINTNNGNNSIYIAKKYGFKFSTNNKDDIFKNEGIDTVFIVTCHNTHAALVIEALQNGKNVFVEKPLALTPDELEKIKETFLSLNIKPIIMVGYNRRYSSAVQEIKRNINDDLPKSIFIRVNAGNLPVDNWVNDPQVGGGRIIGEGCHFIDLACYLAGSRIISVFAKEMKDIHNLNNDISINLSFENGSIATILYLSNGNKKLGKEYMEVFYSGNVFIIDDFKELRIYSGRNSKKIKSKGQDKGHKNELKLFVESIKTGVPLISFDDLYLSSYVTFNVLESIKSKKNIEILN